MFQNPGASMGAQKFVHISKKYVPLSKKSPTIQVSPKLQQKSM